MLTIGIPRSDPLTTLPSGLHEAPTHSHARGAPHGHITHWPSHPHQLAQESPAQRPHSRGNPLPLHGAMPAPSPRTMRGEARLRRKPPTTQRRTRPHQALRLRRREHPRERANNLPTLQRGTRQRAKATNATTTDHRLLHLVTPPLCPSPHHSARTTCIAKSLPARKKNRPLSGSERLNHGP